MHFKVRPGTKFEKARARGAAPRDSAPRGGPRALTSTAAAPQIFDAYCTKKSLARDHVRFLFDGNRIQGTQTPAEVRRFGPRALRAAPHARRRAPRSWRWRTATASTP